MQWTPCDYLVLWKRSVLLSQQCEMRSHFCTIQSTNKYDPKVMYSAAHISTASFQRGLFLFVLFQRFRKHLQHIQSSVRSGLQKNNTVLWYRIKGKAMPTQSQGREWLSDQGEIKQRQYKFRDRWVRDIKPTWWERPLGHLEAGTGQCRAAASAAQAC